MNERQIRDGLIWILLVAVGVGLRLALTDIPNFSPVAAFALLAGFWFRSAVVGLLVPLSIMSITDCFLGGYSWPVMLAVYGMLAAPVGLRSICRRTCQLRIEAPCRDVPNFLARASAGLVSCSLLMSTGFYLVTNFAVWKFGSLYPQTSEGLRQCYVNGLPFFRYTWTGDLLFTFGLFGTCGAMWVVSGLRYAHCRAAVENVLKLPCWGYLQTLFGFWTSFL